MTPTVAIKQGATFGFTGVATDGINPMDLTGYTLKSQVRDRDGVLVDTLSTTVDSAIAGTFTVVASTGTLAYPLGTLELDIRLTHSTAVEFSETVLLNVTPSVTR